LIHALGGEYVIEESVFLISEVKAFSGTEPEEGKTGGIDVGI
jgi:hypothetical protein